MGIIPSRVAGLGVLRSKHAVPLGYALFFLLAFIFFFVLTLPDEALLERVKYEVRRNTPYTVDFESADVSSLLGIELRGVVLSRGESPVLALDMLRLDPSLYSLLGGRISLPYEADLFGGLASGVIALSEEWGSIRSARIELSGIDLGEATRVLSRIRGVGENIPILEGSLAGVAEMDMDGGARGNFHLTSSETDIVELSFMGQRIPSLGKLNSSLKGEFVNKTTIVEDFSIKGEGLDLKLTGTVPIPWIATRRDKVDLRLVLRTDEPRLALLKSLLTEKPDGSSAGRIVGTWSRPRLIGDSSVDRRRIRGPATRSRTPGNGM